DIASFRLEHCRENNTMKYYVVFSYKMHQFGIVAFPVGFPAFPFTGGPFLCGRYIAYWGVKPNIQYFSLSTFDRHRNSPVQVTGHCTRAQAIINPRFYLPIYIGFPVFFMVNKY